MLTLRLSLVSLLLIVSGVRAKKLKLMKLENTLDFGENSDCHRECDGVPRDCVFNLTLSVYSTFSMHCGDCPRTRSHCSNRGCVTAGGTNRPIYVANLALPGPGIHVCQDDRVVVRVENAFPNEGATLHWHGVWMRGCPHMDGVPYVTQCPIQPNNVFEYAFSAYPAGTHMWHSHIGLLETDGLFGPLVIRRPAASDPHRHLYDEDLVEHTVSLWHWYPSLSGDYLSLRLYRNQTVAGASILVNGKGRRQGQAVDGEPDTPLEEFHVEQGKRYRFRFIFNSAVFCPVQVSVDNHTLLAIATDGADFMPVRVDSLMLNAGERWDAVLTADQAVGTYWVRIRALGDCDGSKSRVAQQALLVYRGSLGDPDQVAVERPTYDTSSRPGKLLNPMQVVAVDYSAHEVVRVTDLFNVEESTHGVIGMPPNNTLYVALNFRVFEDLIAPGPYPQNNDISFEYPAVPMILQRFEKVPSKSLCNTTDYHQHCVGGYCSCTYTERVKLGALVEIVLVDLSTDRALDHPYHIHGTNFHVVAEGVLGANVSVARVRELNERGDLPKELTTAAPLKDTVTVPSQGYAVIRLRANNPGFWFFHCHVSNHVHLGMGLVLQIGDEEDMVPVPRGFPRCGDWSFTGFDDDRDGDGQQQGSGAALATATGATTALLTLVSLLLAAK